MSRVIININETNPMKAHLKVRGFEIFDYYGDRNICPKDGHYITDPSKTHPYLKGEILIDTDRPNFK